MLHQFINILNSCKKFDVVHFVVVVFLLVLLHSKSNWHNVVCHIASAKISSYRLIQDIFSVCLTKRRVLRCLLLLIFASLANNVLVNMIVYSMANSHSGKSARRESRIFGSSPKKEAEKRKCNHECSWACNQK